MSTVVIQQSFEEKLMDRIRESIGELMSDEDLKRIVEKGVDRALFERRTITSDGWSRSSSEKPSFVDTVVKTLLEERMRVAVDAWIRANPEKLDKALNDAIVLGAGSCVIAAFNENFRGAMLNMQAQMLSQIQRPPS